MWIVECACRRFSVSAPTIERDLREIRARWSEEAAASRDDVRAELAAQIDRALVRVHQQGEVKALAALLRLKAQFHGFIAEKTETGGLTPEQEAALRAFLGTRPAPSGS